MTDVELLARLIKCEAGGEGLEGMAAVASVIMNRVNSFEGEYGRYNTIRDVIFAPRQFECVTGGNEYYNIYTVVPELVHYQMAEWAIAGGRLNSLEQTYWFFNPYATYCPPNFPSAVGIFNTRLGDHCFYNPTAQYWTT